MIVIERWFLFLLIVDKVLLYEKISNDFDRYGTKIDLNDRLLVTVNNINVSFNVKLSPYPSKITCNVLTRTSVNPTIEENLSLSSSCDFIYSVVVPKYNPLNKSPYFVYNCIDQFGNNVIGIYTDTNNNNSCNFHLEDSQIVGGNYSTQDNFVLCMSQDGSGTYGIADDFIIYYNHSSFQISIVSPIAYGLSPRACEIIVSNLSVIAIIAGYSQTADWCAQEMLYLVNLNPFQIIDSFNIPSVLYFSLGDPRRNRWVANSRIYSPQNSISLSIASRTGQILVGAQSLNTVLILQLDNINNPTAFIRNSSLISSKQNGVSMGFGKSVTWLDDNGEKCAILANNYSYSSYQWISSSVNVYDIGIDGFNDSSLPINIYPNSEQVLQSEMSPSLIRLVSSLGNVALFDDLGTPFVLLSSPPATYPSTFTSDSFSLQSPCIRGTYSDNYGIELCTPCPNGTYSSGGVIRCSECDSRNYTYCTYGAVTPINYQDIYVIEKEESYPDPPEGTIFDDILLENMFTWWANSGHCTIVAPLTWVFVVIGLALTLLIIMGLLYFYPRTHTQRNRIKTISKHMDLIGEGEMWFGGAMSAGIIVFLAFAYAFSNAYYNRYPLEKVGSSSWFGCQEDMRNSKFSSSMQMVRLAHFTEDNDIMYNMLDQQLFILKIDLINTAFTCNDSFIIERTYSDKVTPLQITSCNSSYNDSIISLNIPLPTRLLSLQLILLGIRTVGGVRIGLTGPGGTNDNGRLIVRELDFAEMYISASTDQILASLVNVPISMTAVINQTSPLNLAEKEIYSAEWSFTTDVQLDQFFTVENRYTFYKRSKTIVSITLTDTVFLVNNLQQPIARRNEIIFHNLLFTIVILELFRLIFLFVKLMFMPICQLFINYINNKNKEENVSIDDNGSNTETNSVPLNLVVVRGDQI